MATPGGTSARVCGICKSVIGDGKEDTLRIQCEGSCQLWAVVHRRCAGDESFLCVYCTSCQAQQETVLQLKEEMNILTKELADLRSTVETFKKANINNVIAGQLSAKNVSSPRRTARNPTLRGKHACIILFCTFVQYIIILRLGLQLHIQMVQKSSLDQALRADQT